MNCLLQSIFFLIYFLFFSLWDRALPAALLLARLVLLSLRTFEALLATLLLVTFLAILVPPDLLISINPVEIVPVGIFFVLFRIIQHLQSNITNLYIRQLG